MRKQQSYCTKQTNSKLFRSIILGILTVGATFGNSVASEIALTNPNWSYSSRAFAQDIGERVVEKAGASVVSINTGDRNGSGIIVRSNGLVLTNAHVVEGVSTATVIHKDGKQFQADVIAFSESCSDLALLQIRGQNDLPNIDMASSNSVRVGQQVFALGNPLGELPNSFRAGIVSNVNQESGIIQTDAAIFPGDSGGALLNSRGELIGVNTSGLPNNPGINFAISIEQVQLFLQAFDRGRVRHVAQNPALDQQAQKLSINSSVVNGKLETGDNIHCDRSFYDLYKFEGKAGQQIIIDMTSQSLDSYLMLASPDNRRIEDDNGGSNRNARIVATLPVDGIYSLIANSRSAGESGDYSLQIEHLILLRQDVLNQGDLIRDDSALYREYSFQGQAGQHVSITLDSPDFDAYLLLYSPDGELVEKNDDRNPENTNSTLTLELDRTGEYRVVVSTSKRGQGQFILAVH